MKFIYQKTISEFKRAARRYNEDCLKIGDIISDTLRGKTIKDSNVNQEIRNRINDLQHYARSVSNKYNNFVLGLGEYLKKKDENIANANNKINDIERKYDSIIETITK